jgi:hypothetical protein
MGHCDEFEILIEMAAQAALDPSESERLNRHVARCTECTRYRALAVTSRDQLRDAAGVDDAGLAWSEVEKRVRQVARGYQQAVPRMVMALVVIVPIIGWVAGWMVGVGAATVGAVLVLHALRERRRRSALAAWAWGVGGDLWTAYRVDLDQRLQRTRVSAVVEVPVGIFLVGLAVWMASRDAVAMPIELLVFYAVWGALLLTAGLRHTFADLPWIRAERAECDEVDV